MTSAHAAHHRHVWVVGAGRFGLRAFCKLRKRIDARCILIDNDLKTCEDVGALTEDVVCEDAVDFLVRRLKRMGGPEWIVPAVPVHLIFEWMRRRLNGPKVIRTMPVPGAVAETLPNPMEGEHGELYVSNADFMCPANCKEPDSVCSYTGKARPRILFQSLRELRHAPFRSIVIRSRQLAPGVGGYTPRNLFEVLDAVIAADGPVLLSTACKCHGVMQAFTIESNPDFGKPPSTLFS